jgi:anti-sigma B factor antagonist
LRAEGVTYSISTLDNSIQIELSGSVDLSATPAFKEEFESLMSSDVKMVLINAGRLDYIDSSGVASLLFIRKLCARFNSDLIFNSISTSAARVIQLANLDSVLGINSTAIIDSRPHDQASSGHPESSSFSMDDALSIFK